MQQTSKGHFLFYVQESFGDISHLEKTRPVFLRLNFQFRISLPVFTDTLQDSILGWYSWAYYH
jgi:hypothetical protein